MAQNMVTGLCVIPPPEKPHSFLRFLLSSGWRFTGSLHSWETTPFGLWRLLITSSKCIFFLPLLALFIRTVCQAIGSISRKRNTSGLGRQPFPRGHIISDFILTQGNGAEKKQTYIETYCAPTPGDVPHMKYFTAYGNTPICRQHFTDFTRGPERLSHLSRATLRGARGLELESRSLKYTAG